jgi:hypothetical protein
MPSATLDAIIFRSNDPVKPAMDVICLIILQLLTLMVVAAEQNPQQLRDHPALGSRSILARLDRGETFDLPTRSVASIRSVVRLMRADLRLDDIGGAPSGASLPAQSQNPAARANSIHRRPAARERAARPINHAPLRALCSAKPATAQPRGHPRVFERIDGSDVGLSTPISLLFSNGCASRPRAKPPALRQARQSP